MYKSPIEIIHNAVQTKMEDDVVKAVQSYGIIVDKKELLRALGYDRGQYDKGFEDGISAMEKVIEWLEYEIKEESVCKNRGYKLDAFEEVLQRFKEEVRNAKRK